MANTTIDKIEVQVTATATAANKTLASLKKNMDNLKSTLTNVNITGLTNLTNALNKVSTSLDNLSSKVKTVNGLSVTPKVDTSNISKSEKDVQSRMNKIKESLDGLTAYGNAAMGGDSSALTSFDRRVTSIQSSIDTLRGKLDTLKDVKIPNEEFIKLESEIENTTTKLNDLFAEEQKMKVSGVSEESDEWIRLQSEIGNAKDELNEYIAKQTEMKANGQDSSNPFESISSSLDQAQSRLTGFSDKVHSVTDGMKITPTVDDGDSTSSLERIQERGEKVKAALLKIGSTAVSAFSKMKNAISSIPSKLSNLAGKVTGLNSSFAKGIGTILKYGLGIRSLYVLFRRLRTAITDSFSELQNSGAFYQTTAANIDSLKNALLTLKYQFGAAFEPIFNYIAPALQTLINYLITAMNVLSAFFAKLTGNSTYSKVKSVTAAVAKNTGSAASNAKELNKQLQGFDELNNLTSNSGSSGGGGSGSTDESAIYETANVADTLSGVGEKLGKIWDVFKQAWDSKGKAVIEAATSLLTTLKNLAVKIADTFYTVFTEGYGYKWLTSVLDVVISVLNNINAIATAFSNAWDSKGYDMTVSIFGMLTSINETIATITDSWSKAWSNHGTAIFENILQSVTSINNTIKNLSDNFRKAWNEAGVGDSICDTILGIVEDISGTIEDITSATEEWSKTLDFGPLLSAVDTTLKSIRGFLQSIQEIAKSLYTNYILPILKKLTESTVPAILEEISGFIDSIKSILDEIPWDTIWGYLEDLTEMGLDSLVATLKSSLDSIKGTLSLLKDELKAVKEVIKWIQDSGLSDDLSTIGSVLKIILDKVNLLSGNNNIFEKMFPNITSIVSKLTAISEAFKTLWSWKDKSWSEIGKDIVNGLGDGLADALLPDWIKGFFDPIIGWVKDLFGIHSPSTVFEAIGEDIIEGLKKGLKSAVTKIKNWIKTNVTDKIKGFFNGVKTITISIAGKVLDSFTKTKEKWDDFKDKVATLKAEAKEKVSGAIKKLKDQWDNFPTDLKQLWTSAKEKVGETIERIKNKWDSWTDTAKDLVTTAKEKAEGVAEGTIAWLKNKWDSWTGKDTEKDLIATATDNDKSGKSTIDATVDKWKRAEFKAKYLDAIASDNGSDGKSTIEKVHTVWKNWLNTNDTKTLKAKATDEGTIASTQTTWNSAEFKAKTLSVAWDSDSTETLKEWNNVKTDKNVIKTLKLGGTLDKDYKTRMSNWNNVKTETVTKTLNTVDTNGNLATAVENWNTLKNSKSAELSVTFNDSFTYKLTKSWNDMVTAIENALKKKGMSTTSVPGRITALGGAYYGGAWHNIPQYANGTFDALKHGSIFAAGENGPEVVGHINGRTEVLNRSQIASTMFSAITNGMKQFKNAQMVQPPQLAYANGAVATFNGNDTTSNNDALIAEQNRLLAEQNSLLQIIANKDVSISSREVFNATRSESNNYFNRTGNSPFLF